MERENLTQQQSVTTVKCFWIVTFLKITSSGLQQLKGEKMTILSIQFYFTCKLSIYSLQQKFKKIPTLEQNSGNKKQT